jgi:uncharacterized membrane protein YhaH (DUF805 family)
MGSLTRPREENVSWYLAVLGKYAVFAGRARRKEYWMFALMNFLIAFAIGIIAAIVSGGTGVGYSIISACYTLFVLIPSIAVGVRRLHDIGRSGWWLWISLVPVLGAIVLLIFAVQDSEPGQNAYGPNPKTEFA